MNFRGINELLAEFDSVNIADDKALLAWLLEIFGACDVEAVEVPHRHRFASRIGEARGLAPAENVPGDLPQHVKATWLLEQSLGALVADGEPEGLAELYGNTALAIEAWLLEQRGA